MKSLRRVAFAGLTATTSVKPGGRDISGQYLVFRKTSEHERNSSISEQIGGGSEDQNSFVCARVHVCA